MKKFAISLFVFLCSTSLSFASANDPEEQCVYKNEKYSDGAIVPAGNGVQLKCVVSKTIGYPTKAEWVAADMDKKSRMSVTPYPSK